MTFRILIPTIFAGLEFVLLACAGSSDATSNSSYPCDLDHLPKKDFKHKQRLLLAVFLNKCERRPNVTFSSDDIDRVLGTVVGDKLYRCNVRYAIFPELGAHVCMQGSPSVYLKWAYPALKTNDSSNGTVIKRLLSTTLTKNQVRCWGCLDDLDKYNESGCALSEDKRDSLCRGLATMQHGGGVAELMCKQSDVCTHSPNRKLRKWVLHTTTPEQATQEYLKCCYLYVRFDMGCANVTRIMKKYNCEDIPQRLISNLEEQSCPCTSLPRRIQLRMRRCSDESLKKKPPSAEDFRDLDNLSGPVERHFGLAAKFMSYLRPDELDTEALMSTVFMRVAPKALLDDLAIDNEALIRNIGRLPDAKALHVVGRILENLSDDALNTALSTYVKYTCDVWKGISLDYVKRVDLKLAKKLCKCEYQTDFSLYPTKHNALCEVINAQITSYSDLMKNNTRSLCGSCFAEILHTRNWTQHVLEDTQHKKEVCKKVGNSNHTKRIYKEFWAANCEKPRTGMRCTQFLPYLTPFVAQPPSYEEIEACADHFCSNLCLIGTDLLDKIRKVLLNTPTRKILKLECLAFLSGLNFTEHPVYVSSLPSKGYCRERMSIINALVTTRSAHRRTRASCRDTCEQVELYQEYGIPATEVITEDAIDCVSAGNILQCLETARLGEAPWNERMAKELLVQIRRALSLKNVLNSTTLLEHLGTIGTAFTPAELSYMEGLNYHVFGIFGAATGWGNEQGDDPLTLVDGQRMTVTYRCNLRVLKRRFLRDNRLRLPELTFEHIAHVNHIVCGLSTGHKNEVKGINDITLRNSVAVLGQLKQCQHKVLREIATRYKQMFGPVARWKEEDFAEAGIVLAGLNKEDLQAAGLSIVDHISVSVITHMDIEDFKHLSRAQLKTLRPTVAELAAKRGFCPHLHLSDVTPASSLHHYCQQVSGFSRPYIQVALPVAIMVTRLLT